MENNAIGRILLVGVGFLVALFATFGIFASGMNVLGQSFRYLTPLAFLIGVLSPRAGIVVMLLSGAYLDIIKRLMVLDSGFGYLDIAFMLALPPAIMGGIVLGILISWLMGRRPYTGRELMLFFATCVVGGILAVGFAFSSGGGLRSAGDAVNAAAYLFLGITVPVLYQSREDIMKLLKLAAFIFLPAALWAIKQKVYGLEDFELRYLRSGFTNEERQLYEMVFRNMGTMVSANVLSMVASILVAAAIIPIRWKTGTISFKTWLNPGVWLLVVIYGAAAAFTYSRTGWVCGLIAIVIFFVIQIRWLTYASLVAGFVSLCLLYGFAGQIHQSRILNEWQDYLFADVAKNESQKQMMVVGTLEGRFDSMAQFVGNKDIWTPFGLKIAKKENALGAHWAHEVATETLVMVGYVPMAILAIAVITMLLWAVRANFRLPPSPERALMRYFLALAGGMLVAGLGQGKALFIFPMNFFWCFFLAAAYGLYLMGMKNRSLSRERLPSDARIPERIPPVLSSKGA